MLVSEKPRALVQLVRTAGTELHKSVSNVAESASYTREGPRWSEFCAIGSFVRMREFEGPRGYRASCSTFAHKSAPL